MTTPHAPCWDGWASADRRSFDAVWRVDFSVHFFTNGRVACSLLPVCTADGGDLACVAPQTGVEELLTVVITSSPVRSNPSTRMLQECMASLNRNGGLARCRKVIMCDGFKVRQRSQRKLGVVTDEEAVLYREYVHRVVCLCRTHPDFRRARLVRLARRQGSAYAIREAIGGHVSTPLVLVVPHDCVIARPLQLETVAAAMHARLDRMNYIKLAGPSTATYAEAVLQKHGVRLQPTIELARGLTLTPMLRYMDNVAIVSVAFLRETVFAPGSLVRRGTFIEDTFGKHTQMQEWVQSAAFAAKRPPSSGCFLLSDGRAEPMMRHLDGKTYLDPEQRASKGYQAYPTDWTAALQEDREGEVSKGKPPKGEAFKPIDACEPSEAIDSSAAAQPVASRGAPKRRCACEGSLVPLRDALCWDSLGEGCNAAACERLHPVHAGSPVCGRHATSLLALWGRRRRPPCQGDCGKAHPSANQLEAALCAALPDGSRLHAHVRKAPSFSGEFTDGIRSLYVVPRGVPQAEVDASLDARAPMALRVALDLGFDRLMSGGERRSLATQCGFCHGTASLAEHRDHVALAICSGAPPGRDQARLATEVSARDGDAPTAVPGTVDERPVGPGQPQGVDGGSTETRGEPPKGDDSLSLLRAAGLERWHPLAWESQDGEPLSLLTLPGAGRQALVYLSPEAPDVLTHLDPSEVYVIGGLVDRRKIRGASHQRATALGIRCARLPLMEHLPPEMRGRSNALDALNLNSVFRLLVEWSKCRDWTVAMTKAFEGSQRHCCSTDVADLVHPRGYWLGPQAASQHQYDRWLSDALLAFFQGEHARTIADLGCGMGVRLACSFKPRLPQTPIGLCNGCRLWRLPAH